MTLDQAMRCTDKGGVVLVGNQRSHIGGHPSTGRQPQPLANAETGSLPEQLEVDAGVHHGDAVAEDPIIGEHACHRFGNGDDPVGPVPKAPATEVKIHSAGSNERSPGQSGADAGQSEGVRIVGVKQSVGLLRFGENRPDDPGIEPGPPGYRADRYAGGLQSTGELGSASGEDNLLDVEPGECSSQQPHLPLSTPPLSP